MYAYSHTAAVEHPANPARKLPTYNYTIYVHICIRVYLCVHTYLYT